MRLYKENETMPVETNNDVGPAIQPAQCRPCLSDTHGSAFEQGPGWWCDRRGMRWENYHAEGNTTVEQGQYAEAGNFFHAAIEQAEQMGSFNPRLAGSLNELGILYAKQHKYAQAEPLFQRALGVSVAAMGSDHPDVAVILRNIAILKASQRHYAEADLLLNQSLSLTSRVFGHEHSTVAITMRTIAVLQAVQGRYGEAERFIRRSLEISEKTLGTKHPEVAASRKVFAKVLRAGHRETEAPWAGPRM
jgi:tetratricopeptide (TPR) repeat protein